jgi:hypothetical protein
MTKLDEVRAKLQQVSIIDEHAAILEEAITALDDVQDPVLVDDLLAVFERCDGQDDYGMFSSMKCWIERFPITPAIRASVQRSLLRHPTWQVIEMIGGYADSPGHAADLLQEVSREGTFRDGRYTPAWLQKRIDELRPG